MKILTMARRPLGLALAVALLGLLAACGTSDVYRKEAFSKESPYQRHFLRDETQVCDAAQRTLLSQGYRIEQVSALNVKARKDFQPDDEVNITIDMDVTCHANSSGSTAYVNAVQTTYELKKTAGGASLSVPGAGSISMPWSKTTDTLVKVAGETISDEAFYKRFFDLLSDILGK
ncbi:MAG: DUF2242 domain-containing protein [Gammaproteobacteria bacterium]|nr:DUF2242 domain-containing protein [Gammaproteobacteria bacterium]MBU0785325.1 DUF2242 domain-containing protein [Gammaproteobacteria bacterium]MBU0815908.1 DUF2242 domain-containing protein [Gammaproteobacteria bacterium]MBU1787447.1 DUF2242 domain-containing protein [Gammaproteobacteria bacterium]